MPSRSKVFMTVKSEKGKVKKETATKDDTGAVVVAGCPPFYTFPFSLFISQAFLRLGHQLLDHGPRASVLLERLELPVGARPGLQNLVRVLDLLARAEFVDHV